MLRLLYLSMISCSIIPTLLAKTSAERKRKRKKDVAIYKSAGVGFGTGAAAVWAMTSLSKGSDQRMRKDFEMQISNLKQSKVLLHKENERMKAE